MALNIHLIRHAESEMNLQLEGIIGGRSNWAELTIPQGVAQSRSLGKRLHEENLGVVRVYSSPAVRTQQTARYSLDGLPLMMPAVLDVRLLELDQGDFEGSSRVEVYQRPDVDEQLKKDNWNFIPGDKRRGESQAMVASRMTSWFEEVIRDHREGDVLVYTHGVAIKALLAHLGFLHKRTAYQQQLVNASITTLKRVRGTYRVVRINDYQHLSRDNIPFIN